jgi:hypothetical protein
MEKGYSRVKSRSTGLKLKASWSCDLNLLVLDQRWFPSLGGSSSISIHTSLGCPFGFQPSLVPNRVPSQARVLVASVLGKAEGQVFVLHLIN